MHTPLPPRGLREGQSGLATDLRAQQSRPGPMWASQSRPVPPPPPRRPHRAGQPPMGLREQARSPCGLHGAGVWDCLTARYLHEKKFHTPVHRCLQAGSQSGLDLVPPPRPGEKQQHAEREIKARLVKQGPPAPTSRVLVPTPLLGSARECRQRIQITTFLVRFSIKFKQMTLH